MRSDLSKVDTDFEGFLVERLNTLPHPYEASGIYFLYVDDEIVYIGQSINMYARIMQHAKCIDYEYVKFFVCGQSEMNDTEARFIMRFKPKHNKSLPKNSVFMRLAKAQDVASRFSGMSLYIQRLPVHTFAGVDYVERNDIIKLKGA